MNRSGSTDKNAFIRGVDTPSWNRSKPFCHLARVILFASTFAAFQATATEISFNANIRTILADRCYNCHGPDAASRKADLRLDSEYHAKATHGADKITPIAPGNPDRSEILQRILSDDPDDVMPPPKSKMKVTTEEAALLRQWIIEGAKWEKHWAFIPPTKMHAPSLEPGSSIDHYVSERLKTDGLKPSPPASPAHVLRRLSFDLTGLPPTLAELNSFERDPSEASYEAAVDRLLASSAFGERMALEWLDVARYGDTDGLFEDHPRQIYAWRDWVVRAFNANLPYRDFITWQLAGDLLPDATEDQKIATGFLRNNPTSNEGGIIDEDYRVKYLVDRVNTTSMAFLGLTMECAQCHDHKFDPMTQREYFQFAGFFNSLVGRGNTKGATAPVLKILPPEKKKRLEHIQSEAKALEEKLKSHPPQLLADFEQWKSHLDDPVVWQQITFPEEKKEAIREYPSSPIKGRYIRLARPSDPGFLTIGEVEVYANGQNIAPAGKATQSSTSHNAPPQRAIDGNNSGAFTTCSCTAEEANAWWELDLGGEVFIDHILIYNRNDCCPERLDHTTVSVLDAARQPLKNRNLGDAPYRTTITLNPDAPEPTTKSSEQIRHIKSEGRITALQLTAKIPTIVENIQLHVVGTGKPREVKLTHATKLRASPDMAAIIGLEKSLTLNKGESLQLKFRGQISAIAKTSDPTAVSRTQIPKDPKKLLEHFTTTWPGFDETRKKHEALQKEQAAIDKTAIVTMIASDATKVRPTYILMRGEYDKKGEEVQIAPPASIMSWSENTPRNRLGLAQWLTNPGHPLTARVAVNRYWQMIFGTGIVKTSEDFGTQGARPSHQALLDHLSAEFIDSDWDVKRLLKLMVMSKTYRQASIHDAQISKIDPENRLLTRTTRQRLPAEFIRDHALAVSGLLVRKIGGPGVRPYQPAALFGRNAIGNDGFKQGTGDDLYRRSLYTYWKRQVPAANMRILGADGRTACRTRREKTNTPLQALVLMNDPQFIEAARVLGERMIKEGGTSKEERIGFAFRLATSRAATPRELSILTSELDERIAEFNADPERTKKYLSGGGERTFDATRNPAELAAYASLAHLILNLDEAISKS